MRAFAGVALVNLAVWLLFRERMPLVWIPALWSALVVLPLRSLEEKPEDVAAFLLMSVGGLTLWAWSGGYAFPIPFPLVGLIAVIWARPLFLKLWPAMFAVWIVAWVSGAQGGAGSMIDAAQHWFHFTPEQAEVVVRIIRKTVHFTAYGTLALLFRRTGVSILAAAGATMVVACGDELRQWFTPGRTGQPSDVLLDMAGAAVFLWVESRRRVGR